MISLTDSQKIGMGLTGFGVFFLFFGMVLFFDKALLAIGNILFVSGLSFVIGLERTFRFFFQRHKVKATSFFLGGVFVVLIGWPIIGVVLEIYGFFLLFRGFFPVAVGFIRRVPVLGSLLSLPGISTLVDKIGESNTMRRNWTPQAILYLKGAQGHRSALKRTSREDLVSHNESNDGLGLSLSSIFLELLQRAVEEGGGNLDNYPDGEELNLNYF
ncbi:Vesicle transport protein GOT1B Golgi transport 1-like protein B [Larimichthys crocea]|uniref:Vesicle transport protein GOT1B Golgi transport 1-like protein B n=1 Tax=Larimichthys crocea TaxID=215358 RepID=A0A6G0IXN7_LARCR|nr:Vesicle transport protein GOT1B Golgi transport 1-like protein B [Larimichthys crocea]